MPHGPASGTQFVRLTHSFRGAAWRDPARPTHRLRSALSVVARRSAQLHHDLNRLRFGSGLVKERLAALPMEEVPSCEVMLGDFAESARRRVAYRADYPSDRVWRNLAGPSPVAYVAPLASFHA